jgi:hypothetical protein
MSNITIRQVNLADTHSNGNYDGFCFIDDYRWVSAIFS